jgi:methionyl-tRNA synthetase
VREFIKRGLQDFSISRLKSKMSWGIPVPGDSEQVMYVWFDALVNYISTLGWPSERGDFQKFWVEGTPTQYCGKDNIRFQSMMWQAMLIAAGLPPTHTVVINGFVTGDGGIKMSKSLGNVVNPVDIVSEYGTDALRYFLLRELSSFEDSPFTIERFKEAYNANLANGIGNLTSRIMKMAETHLDGSVLISEWEDMSEYFAIFETFELNKVMDLVWSKIGELDSIIQEKEPFKLVKADKDAGVAIITDLVQKLYTIARMLNPLLTDTSNKIKAAVKANKMPAEPLFARKD